MKKNVYIMSAKYAPGHFSHMLAYYELFQAIDYIPMLYIDENYKQFNKEYPDYRYKYTTKKVKAPDVLLIYNLSSYDSKIAKEFKKYNSKMKIYFIYHEPWYGIKGWFFDLIHKNESLVESVKAVGRYIFVRKIIRCCDKVILPSNAALKNYKNYCSKINDKFVLFPLIFTDECKEYIRIENKQYFSFISTASNSKNFKLFLDYIRYKAKKDTSAKFQIATRTDVSGYIDDELNQLVECGRLILIHGHSLSNAEINQAYAKSCCTWMLYSRSTQSGVLCKSFMFGAPVIASDIGSFNEAVNDSNGIILPNGYSVEDINNAYNKISASLAEYSDGARNTFLDSFYWKQFTNEFKKLIN